MKAVQRAVVGGLERACRATRLVEWVPGWSRLYPRCQFARWSNALDACWDTGLWPQHDTDEWAEWWDGLSPVDHEGGHWHAF